MDTTKWIKIEEEVLSDFYNSDIDDFAVFLDEQELWIQIPEEEAKMINEHKITVKKINSRNPISRQHYVPQFYLRKLVNSQWRLETCNLKLRKVIKSQAPKEVCCSVYFYAVKEWEYDILSQLVEDLMWVHESRFATIYDRIVKQIFEWQKIADSDLYELCIFASIWRMRSKSFRDTSNNSFVNWFKNWWMSEYLWDRLDSNRWHIAFLTKPENIYWFANLLYGKKIRIYISKWEENFIASDSWVIEVHPEIKDIYGNSFCDRIHYFPLHPKILIEFSHPEWPGKKMKRKEIWWDEVRYYNFLIAMFSNFIYAPLKSDLQEEHYTTARINHIDKIYKLFPKQFLEDMQVLEQCKHFAKERKIHYRNYEELVDKVWLYDIMQTHWKWRTEKEIYQEIKSIDIIKESIKMQIR